MKNFKLTLFVLFNLICLFTFSQGEFIVEIDRINGNYTKSGHVIPGVATVYYDVRAYDENQGIFIFISASPTQRLYSIDVSSDSIISNPLCNNVTELEFSNSLNTLFGIFYDNTNDVNYFVSINPATGVSTNIGNSISVTGIYQGKSTFDQINNKYIFIGSPNLLYMIDATNGNVLSNPTLVLSTGESLVNISFDNSANILYGLLNDNNVQKYFLVSINISTGIITKIGTGTTFGNGNGSSIIDEVNQQYIYLYYNNGEYAITSLDVSTGNVLYNNFIAASSGDLFYSLKYDNIQGKLYSLHWDSLIVSGEQNIQIANDIVLYQNIPNPFGDETTINYYLPETIQNAKMVFYDNMGRIIKDVAITQTGYGSVVINSEKLTNGIYSYGIVVDDKVIDTMKMQRIK